MTDDTERDRALREGMRLPSPDDAEMERRAVAHVAAKLESMMARALAAECQSLKAELVRVCAERDELAATNADLRRQVDALAAELAAAVARAETAEALAERAAAGLHQARKGLDSVKRTDSAVIARCVAEQTLKETDETAAILAAAKRET